MPSSAQPAKKQATPKKAAGRSPSARPAVYKPEPSQEEELRVALDWLVRRSFPDSSIRHAQRSIERSGLPDAVVQVLTDSVARVQSR